MGLDCPYRSRGRSPSAAPPGWDLVWNDEFEGTTLDTAKWTAETTNNPANNEQQAYTPRR